MEVFGVSVISLDRKRMDKQIKFERNLLKELTLNMVQEDVETSFSRLFHSKQLFETAIRDEAVEQAMEAYLLGAESSRFTLLGEKVEDIFSRSLPQIDYLHNELLDYLRYWYKATEIKPWPYLYVERTSRKFFERWWKEGLIRGDRRRKLRLD